MNRMTPLDIQQREFKVGFRGYDRQEVEAFLRTVAQTVEELVTENVMLKERAETTEGQVGELRRKEATLNELLMNTQEMAETLKQTARREAELIQKEAELKAEDLLMNAQAEYGRLQREIFALQKQRVLALEKLRALLRTFHKMIELEELDQDSLPSGTAYKDKELPPDRYEGV